MTGSANHASQPGKDNGMSRPVDPLDRPFPLSGYEAARYGAITTFENAAGKRLVLHRAGRVRDAVAEACEIATGLDPSFRVVCVSTPATVYGDLQGARRPSRDGLHHRGSQTIHVPEFAVVGGKLRHMLHERLRGSGRDEWRDAPR